MPRDVLSSRTVPTVVLAAVMALSGCSTTVTGVATWPGAVLEQALLRPSDFPPGVLYDRIIEDPGQPDGAGEPGPMLSRPQGCSNALTNVIAQSAERGPGSAAKYAVSYDGARIAMTLLSWNLDLDKIEAAAGRCAKFEAFFDPDSPGIPVITAELPGLEPDALGYEQTMRLRNSASSIYMAFQNIGDHAVFGIALPAGNPRIEANAELPQTFLDVFTQQVARIRSS
jgi:hypothetical protein